MDPTDHLDTPARTGLGRRAFLRGAGAALTAGVSITVITACGGGKNDEATGAADLDALPEQAQATIGQTVQSGKIPVGGATFLPESGLILTRPAQQEYRVLSNVCPHAGGKIDRQDERGRLVCPLHGSQFDPATGKALVGPASQPLPVRPVAIHHGTASIG